MNEFSDVINCFCFFIIYNLKIKILLFMIVWMEENNNLVNVENNVGVRKIMLFMLGN